MNKSSRKIIDDTLRIFSETSDSGKQNLMQRALTTEEMFGEIQVSDNYKEIYDGLHELIITVEGFMSWTDSLGFYFTEIINYLSQQKVNKNTQTVLDSATEVIEIFAKAITESENKVHTKQGELMGIIYQKSQKNL